MSGTLLARCGDFIRADDVVGGVFHVEAEFLKFREQGVDDFGLGDTRSGFLFDFDRDVDDHFRASSHSVRATSMRLLRLRDCLPASASSAALRAGSRRRLNGVLGIDEPFALAVFGSAHEVDVPGVSGTSGEMAPCCVSTSAHLGTSQSAMSATTASALAGVAFGGLALVFAANAGADATLNEATAGGVAGWAPDDCIGGEEPLCFEGPIALGAGNEVEGVLGGHGCSPLCAKTTMGPRRYHVNTTERESSNLYLGVAA